MQSTKTTFIYFVGALVPPQPENSFTKPPPRQKPKPSKKPAATVVRPVTEQQVVPRGAAHTLSDSESEGDAEAPQPPRVNPCRLQACSRHQNISPKPIQ